MTTEQRLERLELQNRWMRRIGAVGVAVAVCSLLACEIRDRVDLAWLVEAQCKRLHDKAMTWKMVNRKPPDSLDAMVAPLRQGDEEDFLESVPEDAWGNPFVLEVNAEGLRVRSFGPDGKKGTEDDIVYPGPKD
jgi:hypothetical protein